MAVQTFFNDINLAQHFISMNLREKTPSGTLCGVNQQWNLWAQQVMQSDDFITLFANKCRAKGLTILDAKLIKEKIGLNIPVEPKLSFKMLKAFERIAPHVYQEKGCSLITAPPGQTIPSLCELAVFMQKNITTGQTFFSYEKQLQDPVALQPCRILITNSVFSNTISEEKTGISRIAQEKFVATLGCELPTAQEYFTLFSFHFAIFDINVHRTLDKHEFTLNSSTQNTPDGTFSVGISTKKTNGCYVEFDRCVHNYRGMDNYGSGGVYRFVSPQENNEPKNK